MAAHAFAFAPLVATWGVRLDSGCVSMVWSWSALLAEVNYWLTEGRSFQVIQTERCPATGCHANGWRSVPGRRGMWRDVECKGCRRTVDTELSIEDVLTREVK